MCCSSILCSKSFSYDSGLQASSHSCVSIVSGFYDLIVIYKSSKLFLILSKNALVLDLDRYASVKAIETKSSADDQQWLTYWVLYSFMTLFELTFAKVLEWLVIFFFSAKLTYQNFPSLFLFALPFILVVELSNQILWLSCWFI